MTLNDVLTKQNVITKVILKDGDKELPKELKVKIMRIRMAYNKIKKQFDDDTQEFANQIITDELRKLSEKTDRTPEEDARFNELNDKTNSEYQEYSGNDVEINGNTIKAADLMEIVLDLFVKE